MLKQPLSIAVTAVALLGTIACERRTGDTERDTTVEGTKDDDTRTRTEAGERLSPEMQRRLDEAEQRFTKLERQAEDAKRDLQARGGELRTDLDADVERAKQNVKAKLEAARKASAENARRALDELDAALADLNDRLGEYDRT